MSPQLQLPEPRVRRMRLWTQSESAVAAAIWDRDFADHYGDDIQLAPDGVYLRTLVKIGKATQRSVSSVEFRYRTYGSTFGANMKSSKHATAQALADRDARKEAANQHDLTAATFGDPPPGFSALDRRRRA